MLSMGMGAGSIALRRRSGLIIETEARTRFEEEAFVNAIS